jgi:hypothetical protein
MKRSYRHTAIPGVAILALLVIPAVTSASSQQAAVQDLAGTWTCVTHSSDGKTYQATVVDTMYGKWLKVDSTYPAENGEPAGTGQAYFGYDPKHSRWIFNGVNTSGEYFTNYSSSTNLDGSQWHDGYPNMGGSAVVHLTSHTKYTVDSKGPNERGKMITEHEVCTKQ